MDGDQYRAVQVPFSAIFKQLSGVGGGERRLRRTRDSFAAEKASGRGQGRLARARMTHAHLGCILPSRQIQLAIRSFICSVIYWLIVVVVAMG